MKAFLLKYEGPIAKVAMLAIFLALIRCIAECLRLGYASGNTNPLAFKTIEPFLIGAIMAAVSCLLMVVLSFYSKHKIITVISILTIAGLLIVKRVYLIP